MNKDPIYYPRLSRRIGAMMADSLVLAATLFLCIFIAGLTKEYSLIESVLVILITASVEPLCISLTGSSIGQHIYGLRVRKENEDKPLGVVISYIRFFIKCFFGWISLMFVLTTRKHQALHDVTCKSLVIYKHPERVAHHERQKEREPDRDHFVYPGILRRITFILLYMISSFIALSVAIYTFTSSHCLIRGACSNLDSAIMLLLNLTFWTSLFAISFYGWNGRLYGCRKKRKMEITRITEGQ